MRRTTHHAGVPVSGADSIQAFVKSIGLTLVGIRDVQEVVRYSGTILRGRLRRADVEPAIDLP